MVALWGCAVGFDWRGAGEIAGRSAITPGGASSEEGNLRLSSSNSLASSSSSTRRIRFLSLLKRPYLLFAPGFLECFMKRPLSVLRVFRSGKNQRKERKNPCGDITAGLGMFELTAPIGPK